MCDNQESAAECRELIIASGTVCAVQILIDTVVLSNMERYSSPVHNFVLSGSKSGPNGDMDLLASFNASKTLGEQTFHLNPPGWARYVRLR
jgi:Sad1 / UNC-like C-terminal